MTRRLISSGSLFERQACYSRAVVDGGFVFVAGTTGYDYARHRLSNDVVEQAEQCFVNIQEALFEAGSHLDHAVRVRYILPNRSDFEPCWKVIKKYLGSSRPAATMIVAGLMDEKMKIEIEVTAKMTAP